MREGGLDDIIVTAQKIETNLQKTPISISVLGAEDMENRRVQSLLDLRDGAVPSLRITPSTGWRNSALMVAMRGIIPADPNQPARDAGVGVYIDGVYLARPQGLGSALLDVERIEILKGPQGTLFGRNTTGGALNIVTRKPSGEFHLRQTAGIQNFGGYRVETHLDLPEVAGVSLKLDGILTKRDGTVKNTLQGESDFNSYDRRGIHGAALWRPSENFSAQLDADYVYDATTPFYLQMVERNPNGSAAPMLQAQPKRAKETIIGVPQQESIGRSWGVSLHLDWALDDSLDFRSISSYRHQTQSQYDNALAAFGSAFRPNGNFARYSIASQRQHQVSQEFQLLGSAADIQYVAGLYYFHESADDDAWSPNTMQWNATGTAATRLPSLAAGAATPFPDRASEARATSYAAFGQATWKPGMLDEKFSLTLGGRLTHDKKSGTLTKLNSADIHVPFTFKATHFDPAVTLQFDPNRDLDFYLKWGTGYRAGGANSRSLIYRTYGPEKVSTFEIGAKTEFFDRRVRFNIAAYQSRYTDIQMDFTAFNINGSNRATSETVNAKGKGKIKGIEIDGAVKVAQGLTVSGSYAYTTAKLPPAINPFANDALSPMPLILTPKNAGTGSIDYEMPVGFGRLRAHVDVNLADGYLISPVETAHTDPTFTVNGRLSIGEIPLGRDAQMELSLWSRNLLNREQKFLYSEVAYPVTGNNAIFNEPRTFGADLTIKF
ncbi:MAG: TonB-dependent receptor [Sphingobium sp.]